jgi:hypothetical protein
LVGPVRPILIGPVRLVLVGPIRPALVPVRVYSPVPIPVGLLGPVAVCLLAQFWPVFWDGPRWSSGTSSRQSSETGFGRSSGTALVGPLRQ